MYTFSELQSQLCAPKWLYTRLTVLGMSATCLFVYINYVLLFFFCVNRYMQYLTHAVSMERSDWPEEQPQSTKVVWRSVWEERGDRSVTTAGTLLMLRLSVGSLGSRPQVRCVRLMEYNVELNCVDLHN